MRRVIFIFVDGVGLGANDPTINPLARREYPLLEGLLQGAAPVLATGRLSTPLAELVPVDALLGVEGRPQSATGQAAILTGVNAPARVGEHYGPRPDDRVRALLDEGTIFTQLRDAGKSFYFVNAYPAGFFKVIESGKRRLSSIPYAVTQAGQVLGNHEDIHAGRALSADFTNQGWRTELGYKDAPLYSPREAGRKIWELAQAHDLLFFEHWMTDVLGHGQEMARAVQNFQVIDGVLAGLLAAADLRQTLVILASDHGNVEDLSHSKHTTNPALGLLLGAERQRYATQLHDLTDFAPIIRDFLFASEDA